MAQLKSMCLACMRSQSYHHTPHTSVLWKRKNASLVTTRNYLHHLASAQQTIIMIACSETEPTNPALLAFYFKDLFYF